MEKNAASQTIVKQVAKGNKMRNTWDEYFLKIAKEVSTRATCPRKSHGAVITKNNRIISSGYNGSPLNLHHCDKVGCFIVETTSNKGVEKHCIRTIHSEQNAILQCARFGVSCDGATIYVTGNPCYTCAKLIVGAGIKRYVYSNEYFHSDGLDASALDLMREAGVEVIKIKPNAGLKRVYVAGPYTNGEKELNTQKAIMVGEEIFKIGMHPYIPHLFHFWDKEYPHPWETWMELNAPWLKSSDALFRMEGESKGADLEVARAKELGIPIFDNLWDLRVWANEETEKEK